MELFKVGSGESGATVTGRWVVLAAVKVGAWVEALLAEEAKVETLPLLVVLA